MATPTPDKIRHLLHALRQPVGSFSVRLSLLESAKVTAESRRHLDAMRASVQSMAKALDDLTSAYGLEAGDLPPIAVRDEDGSPRSFKRRE